MGDRPITRRELLKTFGVGGAALVGGSVLGHSVGQATSGESPEYATSADHPDPAAAGGYRGSHDPPSGVGPGHLDRLTFPPPPAPRGTQELEVTVEDRLIEVAAGTFFEAWTYNGSVPAPIIRASEGDRLRIRFTNRTGLAHSLHFHGSHSPTQDGWEPVPPGQEVVYDIVAGPAGVHPYHCHTMPLAEHVGRGLYGMMIVDPPGGRRDATEIALLLSGFSGQGLGTNGVVAWNGVSSYYRDFPIKVETGRPVRAYLVNMVEHEPVTSFHLHARTFDVYPAGMGERPAFSEDTVAFVQGQRAMIEFILPERGRYMFHPHQHWLAVRGAMGWLAAV